MYNKTWQINAQLIDSLKYLHAKHIIRGCKIIRQTGSMNNYQGASSYFLSVCMNIMLWVSAGVHPLWISAGICLLPLPQAHHLVPNCDDETWLH